MPELTRRQLLAGAGALGASAAGLGYLAGARTAGDGAVAGPPLRAVDAGPVLRHGDGPGRCDVYGARDVIVFRGDGEWLMHYDGAGDDGWRLCLARSPDGVTWRKAGAVLELGAPGAPDGATATYGVPLRGERDWHLYYLGSPNASPPPERVPAVPYLTLKATGPGPGGPWTKQPDVVPFRPTAGTYYAETASPGAIIERDGELWQFFSASAGSPLQRTLGIARTRDPAGTWQIAERPILPPSEQIENAAIHFEEETGTWFLFTNHVGGGLPEASGARQPEFTDAVWVYWSDDPARWDRGRRAVVLDFANCGWSKGVIGLPSVQRIGDRLALFYDGLAGSGQSHVGRDVGLAWLDLPLRAPM